MNYYNGKDNYRYYNNNQNDMNQYFNRRNNSMKDLHCSYNNEVAYNNINNYTYERPIYRYLSNIPSDCDLYSLEKYTGKKKQFSHLKNVNQFFYDWRSMHTDKEERNIYKKYKLPVIEQKAVKLSIPGIPKLTYGINNNYRKRYSDIRSHYRNRDCYRENNSELVYNKYYNF